MASQDFALVLLKIVYMVSISVIVYSVFSRIRLRSVENTEMLATESEDCFICKNACPLGIFKERKLAMETGR